MNIVHAFLLIISIAVFTAEFGMLCELLKMLEKRSSQNQRTAIKEGANNGK